MMTNTNIRNNRTIEQNIPLLSTTQTSFSINVYISHGIGRLCEVIRGDEPEVEGDGDGDGEGCREIQVGEEGDGVGDVVGNGVEDGEWNCEKEEREGRALTLQ